VLINDTEIKKLAIYITGHFFTMKNFIYIGSHNTIRSKMHEPNKLLINGWYAKIDNG